MNTNNNVMQPQTEWKGVTIEELKYMRASALIRLEMQKDYLKRKSTEVLPVGSKGMSAMASGISSKMSLAQKIILFAKGAKMAVSLVSLLKKVRK